LINKPFKLLGKIRLLNRRQQLLFLIHPSRRLLVNCFLRLLRLSLTLSGQFNLIQKGGKVIDLSKPKQLLLSSLQIGSDL
jgi:hypothetical protein